MADGNPTNPATKGDNSGQDQRRPIAQPVFELGSDEFWTAWLDAFQAHFEYAKSGTVHGNINPYVIFADSRTGRGFLADYEYPTNVIAPSGYIPLVVRKDNVFEKRVLAKSHQEIIESARERKEGATKAGEDGGSANRMGDDAQVGNEQGSPSSTPLTHGPEAEDPVVPPNQ